jgi:hypothetical protein
VIIGKLIPAGTGFTHGRFANEGNGDGGASQWTEISDATVGDD